MSRRRQNRNPRGPKLALANRKHRRLQPEDKALVVQTYFTIGSVNGTAKKLGIANKTVNDVLIEANNDPALMSMRSRAYDAVGGKITGTVADIIDSIKPEHLETKIHEIRDKEGQLKRVVQTGPSLRDKAFSAGILTDKIKILQDARHVAHTAVGGSENMRLMLPGDVASAQNRVAQLVKSLTFVKMEFGDAGATDARVEELRRKAMVSHGDVEEAELVDFSSPDPFD